MYKEDINKLVVDSPLDIDTKLQLSGRPPTMANSEFLTNKEQGDWAEKIVHKAINENSTNYFSIQYGKSESIAAGDDGFEEFYAAYQNELNAIGKRPDLLIFSVDDFPDKTVDIKNDDHVKSAVAALEIRSSSFLVERYAAFMNDRQEAALNGCKKVQAAVLNSDLGALLQRKSSAIYEMLSNATEQTFRDLDLDCRLGH